MSLRMVKLFANKVFVRQLSYDETRKNLRIDKTTKVKYAWILN